MTNETGEARGSSVASRVAEQLAERIAAGELAIGERLPSERDLVRAFGASRSSVRQAIQALQARGLLEVRDRSGAYVQAPSAGRVSEALMLLIHRTPHAVRIRDLIEVRAVLEVEMAGLAAERRTPEDLREIGRTLADTGSADSVPDWAAADVAFHGALARATGNPLFAVIYDSLRGVLLEQRLRTGTALPETRTQSFGYHQRIFDRICAADAAGARLAMRDHLREARQTMTRYAVEMESSLGPQASQPVDGPLTQIA